MCLYFDIFEMHIVNNISNETYTKTLMQNGI